MRFSSPFRFRTLAVLVSMATLVACDDDPPANYPPPPPPGETVTEATADDPPPQDIQIGVDGDQYSDTDPSALSDFRAPLDPYGVWVDDPVYGTVWVPNADAVGADFTPYVSGGHWVYDDDWVWVSDYTWGWAPFHYGRWVAVDGRGWCWIPGRTYAGAWVVWRTGGDGYGYVGWAPAPPTWGWHHGVAVGIAIAPPAPHFAFVARDEIFASGLRGRIIVGDRARSFEHDTHVWGEPARVAGHPFAYAPGHGPEPTRLGIASDHVVHAAPPAEGVVHAQQYGHPSTARGIGGSQATPHTVRVAPPARPHNAGGRPGGGGGGHHR
jgi:hypothetical protein